MFPWLFRFKSPEKLTPQQREQLATQLSAKFLTKTNTWVDFRGMRPVDAMQARERLSPPLYDRYDRYCVRVGLLRPPQSPSFRHGMLISATGVPMPRKALLGSDAERRGYVDCKLHPRITDAQWGVYCTAAPAFMPAVPPAMQSAVAVRWIGLNETAKRDCLANLVLDLQSAALRTRAVEAILKAALMVSPEQWKLVGTLFAKGFTHRDGPSSYGLGAAQATAIVTLITGPSNASKALRDALANHPEQAALAAVLATRPVVPADDHGQIAQILLACAQPGWNNVAADFADAWLNIPRPLREQTRETLDAMRPAQAFSTVQRLEALRGWAGLDPDTLAYLHDHRSELAHVITVHDAPAHPPIETASDASRMERVVDDIAHLKRIVGLWMSSADALTRLEQYVATNGDLAQRRVWLDGDVDLQTLTLRCIHTLRNRRAEQTVELVGLIINAIFNRQFGNPQNTQRIQDQVMYALATTLADCATNSRGDMVCASGQRQRIIKSIYGYGFNLPGEQALTELLPAEVVEAMCMEFSHSLGRQALTPEHSRWFFTDAVYRGRLQFANAPEHADAFAEQLRQAWIQQEWPLPNGAGALYPQVDDVSAPPAWWL